MNPRNYLDAEAHEAAIWDAGGPSTNHNYSFSGIGERGQLLVAVHGHDPAERDAADAYELQAEQRRRPECFVRKLPGRAVKPFLWDPTGPRPSVITIDEFASQYAAADFAERFGLLCDTSVTLHWGLLGCSNQAEARKLFRSFQKCLDDWLAERDLTPAYFYVHEAGQDGALHTHMQVHVPLDRPDQPNYGPTFREWAQRKWVRNRVDTADPRAVHVGGHNKHSRFRHWIGFHYQMKGYDHEAIVVHSLNRGGRDAIMLGDLIAFPWRNPGVVSGMKRVGWSQALGPVARKVGAPGCRKAKVQPTPEPKLANNTPNDGFDIAAMLQQMPQWFPRPVGDPFQSMYEAGCRDVRDLYDRGFAERVTRLPYDAGAMPVDVGPGLQPMEIL
ncbi:hypothetical protein [Methylobacterium sp. WL7]|uniref:hypothetical protein n=1 Tax=Methylobacterium sp. WL7 TaxID=2603900 RepID=UPI0011C98974|nr:hypothetical protein [Methylobacterium sp. WL7]